MAEWIVRVDDEATWRSLLWALASDIPRPQGQVEVTTLLVAQIKGLKVEVFSNEHPPPHFRVSANGETANYSLEDGSQLNGALQRHRRTIRKWYGENRHVLIDAWNERRPSDCPVGKVRERNSK